MPVSEQNSRVLSPKMRRFAAEFAATGDAMRSAISAGYSPTTARSKSWGWLQDPAVQSAIALAAGAERDVALVSRRYLVAKLKAMVEAPGTSEAGKLKALAQLGRLTSFGGNTQRPDEDSPLAGPEPAAFDHDDDDGLAAALAIGRDRPH